MASANELFFDALVRRQIYLSKFSDGLLRDVTRLLDDTEADIRAVLRERLEDLEGKEFSARTNARLNVLANAIAKIRETAIDGTAAMWDENLAALAEAEAAFLDEALKRYSPVVLDTLLPSATLLGSIATSQPMQGAVLKDWASRMKETDLRRIMDAIRVGMAQGQTTDDIARVVLGTRALQGADGVTQTTRRDAMSITRTAVHTVANDARDAYIEANADIFKVERYTATLDARTTKLCMSLDGNVYKVGEGPHPPLHWQCRSLRVGIIDPNLPGDRPANAASERALEGLRGEARKAKMRQLVGTVPARTTYAEFLARQTHAFQDEVLGPARAKLFRDGGLTLDRFINRNGGEYTLDQLRAREPAAFDRANLD